MPVAQEDTWALDTLRPEEENLAAINALLAESGLPPLKSVITPADLFPIVMTPEQQKYLTEKNNEVLGLLTDEQKQRIRNGENIFSIIDELDPGKQTQIGELAQDVLSNLDQQQKTELMFLGSGMMEGLDLDTRLAILKHLKDNGGEITYDDLVDIGVYAPGALAEGGLLRWLQNLDIGGPAHFGGLLSKEYRLNQFGTSFALLDQEDRMRRGAEMTMLFAMAAAPLLDWVFNGSPNITLDPNKRLESIELEGWNIKGSPSYIDPSEVAKKPDGLTTGTGKININSLDDFFDDAQKFGDGTTEHYYKYFQDNGYDLHPLSQGNFKDIPFDQGGGFKINWGGDRILQYHPAGLNHHGGEAYWKISSGASGTLRFDLNGNLLP